MLASSSPSKIPFYFAFLLNVWCDRWAKARPLDPRTWPCFSGVPATPGSSASCQRRPSDSAATAHLLVARLPGHGARHGGGGLPSGPAPADSDRCSLTGTAWQTCWPPSSPPAPSGGDFPGATPQASGRKPQAVGRKLVACRMRSWWWERFVLETGVDGPPAPVLGACTLGSQGSGAACLSCSSWS